MGESSSLQTDIDYWFHHYAQCVAHPWIACLTSTHRGWEVALEKMHPSTGEVVMRVKVARISKKGVMRSARTGRIVKEFAS